MNTTTSLEEALALALKLAPKERLQLIERVASSVEREIEAPPSSDEQPEEHWGKALNRLMDEIGPIEMKYPEIEDPVEWVKHLRAEERRRRLGDWGEETTSEETE
ncbi:MAG: hypothetical protein SF123_00155 [Chloroflexota bacterium]|nr:hypothetical protein [Chloroflexota bacterium]